MPYIEHLGNGFLVGARSKNAYLFNLFLRKKTFFFHKVLCGVSLSEMGPFGISLVDTMT